MLEYAIPAVIIALVLLSGIKIIRPTHRAAIETLGKYSGFKNSGIVYVVPFIQKLYKVNITEQLVDVKRQDVITHDNLNCNVDAQIYFKVSDSEDDLKKALYNVNSYERQIVQLARTTLRNVIGSNKFIDVNSKRNDLNKSIFAIMKGETENWGISIVRVELKEIQPPEDVQDTMNMVIKAENEKDAAIDFAHAAETKADGEKRAAIKIAEGEKEKQILIATGEATAIETVAKATANEIKMINESVDETFTEKPQLYERLKVTQASLEKNTKYVITENGISPTLVLNGSGDDIIPIKDTEVKNTEKDTNKKKKPWNEKQKHAKSYVNVG